MVLLTGVDDLQRALTGDAIGRDIVLDVVRRERRFEVSAIPRERTGPG
jgi:hypothetical protein